MTKYEITLYTLINLQHFRFSEFWACFDPVVYIEGKFVAKHSAASSKGAQDVYHSLLLILTV